MERELWSAKKWRFLLAALLTDFFLTFSALCPIGAEASQESFLDFEADFALRLFTESAGEDIAAGKNAMISPFSAAEALGLLSLGAEGRTEKEISSVIGDGDLQAFHVFALQTSKRLSSAKKSRIRLASSVWMKTGLKARKTFLALARKYYKAETFTVSFDREAVAKVNAWAERNTDGAIKNLVDSFSDDTCLTLISAAAFQGKWKRTYEASEIRKNQTFTDAEGKKEKATMLESSERFYVSLGKAKGFVKEYRDGDLCYLCLLPGKGGDITGFLKGLTGKKLRKAFLNRRLISGADSLTVRMPEFQSDYRTDLSLALQKMGIRSAFADSAGLSFFQDGTKARITSVIQATHIEVSRKGTKAASATAIECGVTSFAEPKRYRVTLDRPFVYAIIDQKTAIPVFLGAVNTVSYT